MGWATHHHPTQAELDACVQCGLCLPVCPTFRLTGRETASPRGRLHAMSAVAEGVVAVDEAFADVIDFCLGCRACEPVCPAWCRMAGPWKEPERRLTPRWRVGGGGDGCWALLSGRGH